MIEKGIPSEVMERIIFPEVEAGTPEEKIVFVNQMDTLLTKEQILTIMEEQGCHKNKPTAEYMLKFEGKSIEERISLINAMDITEQPRYRLNNDGTLCIYWYYEENGKYICVCPIMSKMKETIPLTFCGCCSGHVKYHAENILGVKLRLLEIVSSPLSSGGGNYCEHLFAINKNENEE